MMKASCVINAMIIKRVNFKKKEIIAQYVTEL